MDYAGNLAIYLKFKFSSYSWLQSLYGSMLLLIFRIIFTYLCRFSSNFTTTCSWLHRHICRARRKGSIFATRGATTELFSRNEWVFNAAVYSIMMWFIRNLLLILQIHNYCPQLSVAWPEYRLSYFSTPFNLLVLINSVLFNGVISTYLYTLTISVFFFIVQPSHIRSLAWSLLGFWPPATTLMFILGRSRAAGVGVRTLLFVPAALRPHEHDSPVHTRTAPSSGHRLVLYHLSLWHARCVTRWPV